LHEASGSCTCACRVAAAAEDLTCCLPLCCPTDQVFGPNCDSQEVYAGSGCKQIVSSVCEGCNGGWPASLLPAAGSCQGCQGEPLPAQQELKHAWLLAEQQEG
jgi:hypothetical protein